MRKLSYLLLLYILTAFTSDATNATEIVWDDNTQAPDTTTTVPDSVPLILQSDLHMQQRITRLINTYKRGITANNTAISVFDISSNTYIYKHNENMLMAPASCMKLLTAVTALDRLGERYAFCDSLFMKGPIDDNGTLHGSFILKMDDDPLFWDFNEWAKAVQARGIKRLDGNVIMHLARRDTLRPHPTDKPWDIQYHKLPLMLKGEKYIKRTFIQALRTRGIQVNENPYSIDDPSLNEYWSNVAAEHFNEPTFDLNLLMRRIALDQFTQGTECIIATRNPLLKVLDPMLIYSSNMKAESLFYHLDNVYGNYWEAHSQYGKSPHEVERFLKEKLGIDTKKYGYVINDGSGLSPANRLSSDFLVRLLLWAYNNRPIRNIFINEALAIPGIKGRTGSLKTRMAHGYTRGRIMCKTGTLVTIGGSSLAGYAQGLNGHWYAFAIIQRDTPVWNARDFQDHICREIIR